MMMHEMRRQSRIASGARMKAGLDRRSGRSECRAVQRTTAVLTSLSMLAVTAAILGWAAAAHATVPIGTAFTYQGELLQNGEAVDVNSDLQFTLWDAVVDGNQIGASLSFDDFPVIGSR